MRKRAQDEYLFAFAFALIIGLFMAVVIWNTAIASGKSSNAYRLDAPIAQFAEDSTRTPTEPAPAKRPEPSRKRVGLDVISSPQILEEPAAEAPKFVLESARPPLENSAQQATSALETSWDSLMPAPWVVGYSRWWAPPAFGGFVGGSYPMGVGIAKASTEQASVGEETPRVVAQSVSRQHMTAPDSAAAESTAAAPASSSPSISALSGPLAATLDGLVPPATVFEDGSWPARDSSEVAFEDTDPIPFESLAKPDPIVQLVESYGDPLVVLAQLDLGVDPPIVAAVTGAGTSSVNPEPATLLLLGTGLGLLAQQLRRRGRRTVPLA